MATMIPRVPVLRIGILLTCLSACGGGGSERTSLPTSEPPQPAPSASNAPLPVSNGHGHFFGEVSIAGEQHYSEALITVDGEIRIYVGGPVDGVLSSGTWLPDAWAHPRESVLFVGRIDSADEDAASASGAVIGQICDSASARFCDEPARAEVLLEVTIDAVQTLLAGELVVMTAAADERWSISMGSESAYYSYPASRPGEYGGAFVEHLAAFAQAEDMVLDIEPDGRMSFASTVSGCTGNGTLLPHLDGRYDVHDVHLVITDCIAQFAYLNSEFDGLATETTSSPWDYDTWLVIFLAAPDGAPPRPALTMRSHLEYRPTSDS